jgi:hypothetical protein
MHPFRAFGRRIAADEAKLLGGSLDVPHRLVLRVLGMGSLNSPDVAQRIHEDLLRSEGCLADEYTLRYDEGLPRNVPVLEGIYLDDHLVVGICDLRNIHSLDGPDRTIVQASHRAYEKHNVARARDKAFGFSVGDDAPAATRFVAWGSAVDGIKGTVRVPVEKCIEIWSLVLVCLSVPRITKRLMQRILGLLVHPLLHQLSVAACLQTAYTWTAQLDDGKPYRWDPSVQEELLAASFLILVDQSDLRAPVSLAVSCTDATPSSGGAVVAVVDPRLSGFLYDHGEHRGEYCRLDHVNRGPTKMAVPTPFTREFLDTTP